MNSCITSHQQRGHTETGPRFKVSSERPEKRGIDLAIPGLVIPGFSSAKFKKKMLSLSYIIFRIRN